MPLSLQELKRIVEKPNPYFKKLRDEQSKLEMHVTGKGMTSYIEKIESFEDQQQIDLRKKYTKSNKDVFKSLLSPLEKIFSAKGGSKIYHFKNKNNEDRLKEKLKDIRNGMSLSKWYENFWKQKAAIDPNGLFFVEHKDGKPYPTFKSIQNVVEYKRIGNYIDWVVFAPIREDKDGSINEYYRVYDETGDYTYLKTNNTFRLIEDYKNPWGYVPAIVVSDLIDTETGFSKSIINEQIEIADHLLLQGSIKAVYTFKFGFPLTWQYKSACPACKGSGEVKGEVCPSCNGSGFDTKRDVSKTLLIDPPLDNDSPVIAPNVSGFSSPDLGAMEQFNTEINTLVNSLWFSKWGGTIEHNKSETATGRFIDAQPVLDVLNTHADSIENGLEQLTDIIAQYYYKDNYEGSSINIGRRFLIETPDQLINKYIEGKQKGMSEIQLTYLLLQYYRTEFNRDIYQLTKYSKLLTLDPFPHLTVTEILGMSIDPFIKKKKIYIEAWSRKVQKEEYIADDVEKLDKKLTDYLTNIKENEPIVQGD